MREDLSRIFDRRREGLALILGRLRGWLRSAPGRCWQWLRSLDLAAARARGWGLLRSAITALQARRSTGRVLFRLSIWIIVLTAGGGLALTGGVVWALQHWPAGKSAHGTARPALLLQAQDGEPLGRMGILKLPDVKIGAFPHRLIAAVLSIEDHRFYEHYGVDPIGIARAFYRNFEAGKIVEGGSTITQQLIKTKYLGNDRSYARKLREALMATVYELGHGKDEILNEYLNSVYLGNGAYGMPAAARLYFDKTPSDLTLPEAATLAGVIRAPSQYNPVSNPAAARERAGVVIDAMHEYGVIDGQTAKQAEAHPATLHQPDGFARARSWFTDWASTEAARLTDAYPQTLRVRTTLVPKLQRLAEQVVNEVMAREGGGLNASQAALVAMRPDGAVIAMVGGRDYDKSQFNRAVEANRHPGSAFKLFVYFAALRKGYSPNDIIDASPVSINGWTPENYGGHEYGSVTLTEGFSHSINTAAVRLAMQVGLKNVIAAARDLGIDAPLKPYPSLALGATGVSLVDLTGAFASVRMGRRVQPWGVAALGIGKDAGERAVGGELADGKPLGPERDEMIALLRSVVESGTGRRASLDGFAAGKTGTSQDYRDAWFIGFNEPLVTGVWVGNDDNSPMKGVVGGSLPATIWKRFMTKATKMIAEDQVRVATYSTPIPALSDNVMARAPEEDLDEPPNPNGACDIAACSQTYQSFRPSDCTYQPYNGPRQFCTRGLPSDEVNNAAAAGAAHPQRDTWERVTRPVARQLFRFFR
ncbi:MAG: PBP1A family penicillin-binding protein [Bradyrhizobium sp.]